ncbi:thioredoxin-2-like [Mizuhopecten yessoensis]|uniref:thioredoxin-2-like n=1 Tax=Mizuhopecten yessoensis TaxID=6573 RepID=UPI000B45D496|nr:thioredoxin-2-like [Mizuhopecten yessoensis]
MSIETLSTKADFDAFLATDKLVVIDFYADWCGPCRMIAPQIQVLASENTDVSFGKVNVDDNTEVAESCKISAMPTFQFYKGKKKVEEVVGADIKKITDAVAKNK